MSFASLAEGMHYLEARGVMPESAPSLEPMRRALARAPWMRAVNAQRQVILAGTNGKGTTAATLSALLHSAGVRVGLYTSPHLVSACERFRVAEEDIAEETFLRALAATQAIIEEERLSHFEALTLMGTWIFFSGAAVAPCDWCLWEVGLGGLWDATNAIPHQACAITKLGLDHEALLGHTLPAIAAQKFAVIPQDGLAVFSPMEPELASLREEVQHATGCTWIPALPMASDGWTQLRTPWGDTELALVGARAGENTATALTLFATLGFSPEEHLPALRRVRWPGRFQRVVFRGREIYLSGDHNPQGVASLLEILQRLEWRELHVLFGACADKSIAEMATLFGSLPRQRIYLTETPFKTLPLSRYPEVLRQQATACDPDPLSLLQLICQRAQPEDLILVTGSLYLVGEILERLED